MIQKMEQKAQIALQMKQVSKHFPGVTALSNVDFSVTTGEIHALMGENGAGKSTLIKVLTGVETFETGEIHILGKTQPIQNHSPQEAEKNGIHTVYQEGNLCLNLSVAENIFLQREPKKWGRIDWKTMYHKAKQRLEEMDIVIDVKKPLGQYSIAIQQMVAIARATVCQPKILILDEPTSSLDDTEVKQLFTVMQTLKQQGTSIIFVTHFLEQVYAVCDRITVLRNGELVGTYETENLSRMELVAKMMGKEFNDLEELEKESISAQNRKKNSFLCMQNIHSNGLLKPFNLEIAAGEVIGLAGLLGSGRSEMAKLLYGAEKIQSGLYKIDGEEQLFQKPMDAIRKGLALCPENRKEEGIIAQLSVRENLILAEQAKRGIFHLLSQKEQREATARYISLLQIKTANQEVPIKQLSGGNQQKVILGRWLFTNPKLLILDEPTRGIDVGTKTEIQKQILKLAKEGMAVVFISSEWEEMLRTVHRMIILKDREKVGELEAQELSQKHVMQVIARGGVE